jgi:hypothetical protein
MRREVGNASFGGFDGTLILVRGRKIATVPRRIDVSQERQEKMFRSGIMRRQIAGWVLASWAMGISGCQSWSQVGQGIPSGARVPPPGTGTYQVPPNYYNNATGAKTGAVSSNGQPANSNNLAAGTASNPAAARTASQPLNTSPAGANTAAAGANTGGPSTVTTAAWQPPTVDQLRTGINSTASAVFDDVGSRANQVVQAGTSRAAAAVDKYTDPAPSLRSPSAPQAASPASAPSGAATSRSLSDNSTAEEPQLDWQAPQ